MSSFLSETLAVPSRARLHSTIVGLRFAERDTNCSPVENVPESAREGNPVLCPKLRRRPELNRVQRARQLGGSARGESFGFDLNHFHLYSPKSFRN